MSKIIYRIVFNFLMLGIVFAFIGCATTSPQLTPLQRRVLECKEFEGTFDDAFKATIAVLQDKGYMIKTSDSTGGIVYAETGFTNVPDCWFGLGNYQYKISVNLEKFTENRIKIRLSLNTEILTVAGGPWPFGPLGNIRAGPVDDPQMYQDLYAEIQKEMFRRAQLNK